MSRPPVPEAAPRLEFLMAISAEVGETNGMGPGPLGEHRVVFITGGTFEGPQLRGMVVGGADWQIVRRDGAELRCYRVDAGL